ncbi:hypothetical protein T492DRAFT_606675 [Pavlovales sp. CCMP2436]|nr:hypothetical protein T492DRAFT_606675 [Pavlovales sp. CCMP2436]
MRFIYAFIYFHMHSYTFICIHILSYTFIYIHVYSCLFMYVFICLFVLVKSVPEPVTAWNVEMLRQAVVNGTENHPGANFVQVCTTSPPPPLPLKIEGMQNRIAAHQLVTFHYVTPPPPPPQLPPSPIKPLTK